MRVTCIIYNLSLIEKKKNTIIILGVIYFMSTSLL